MERFTSEHDTEENQEMLLVKIETAAEVAHVDVPEKTHFGDLPLRISWKRKRCELRVRGPWTVMGPQILPNVFVSM
jgi:hypothetical protein